ncbi:hypothetical protein ACERII_21170 [Evansella sp. AB-rgal1]|uniref:hypothetical protein n=1 Tax=Evansella sp. AB-rgal1 TaxID=3242696 RepID=UPI00359D2995
MLRKTIVTLILIVLTSFSITIPSTYAASDKYITKIAIDHETMEIAKTLTDLDEIKKIYINYPILFTEAEENINAILFIYTDYIAKQKLKYIVFSIYNKVDLVLSSSQILQ